MKINLILLSSILLLFSCSPKISTSIIQKVQVNQENKNIIVYNIGASLPKSAKKIGTTKIGDSGFTTNCDYNTMLTIAKHEAKKNGANALQITDHILPSVFGSSCHRLAGNLLLIDFNELDQKPMLNSEQQVSKAITKTVSPPTEIVSKKSKFLIMATIAQGYRVAASPDNLDSTQKEYLKKLKSGLSKDISFYYLFEQEAAVGLKYNLYESNGTIQNQTLKLPNGTFINGAISDNIKITFIGPSLLMTEGKNSKLGEGNLEMALGYLGYENKGLIVGVPLKITGSNLGMIAGMGYHFRILPSFLIGGQVNFVGGVLTKIKYTYPDGTTKTEKLKDEAIENLWRIDLAVGAKFRF